MKSLYVISLIGLSLSFSSANALEYVPDKDAVATALVKKEFSPYAGREFPTRLFIDLIN